VIRISFVSEHIETPRGIDIEYREIADRKAGIQNFPPGSRPSITYPTFIKRPWPIWSKTALAGTEVNLDQAAKPPQPSQAPTPGEVGLG